MSLQAVFDAYPERLGRAALTFVGPERGNDQSRPPRIAWNPTAATHSAPKETGVVITRQWRINVEIWGIDLEQTEELVHDFIRVTHDICSRFSYALGSETWNTGGVSADGCRCDLIFLLQVPVLKTQPATRPITDFIATQTMGDTQV